MPWGESYSLLSVAPGKNRKLTHELFPLILEEEVVVNNKMKLEEAIEVCRPSFFFGGGGAQLVTFFFPVKVKTPIHKMSGGGAGGGFMSYVHTSLVIALLGTGSVALLLYIFQNKLLYFPNMPPDAKRTFLSPASFGLERVLEEVFITTSDNLKIQVHTRIPKRNFMYAAPHSCCVQSWHQFSLSLFRHILCVNWVDVQIKSPQCCTSMEMQAVRIPPPPPTPQPQSK